MIIHILSKRNIVLSIFLLAAIVFSIITVVRATTPNPGHSFSEINLHQVTRTTSATLLTTETVVLADASTGPITLTLPPAAGITPRTIYFIKKIDSALANLVTIDGNAAETIDGSLTITLAHRGEGIVLQTDGANWRILQRTVYDISAFRTKGATLNQWYTSPNTGAALGAGAPTANVLRAIPFIVSKTTTIDQMAISVTTAVAGLARIGIYADNGNNYPGALVVEATSVTQIDTGIAGVRIATGGLPVVLQPGLYWLAIVGNAAPTIRTFTVASMLPVLGYASTLPTAASLGWFVTFTYAALPSTFPAGGSVITTGPPAIFVRTSL
ncbi:MAG: hypothetical protein DDT19_02831 [Syntrophomonadaceae bacterium]|nr:hypothetical protein [Bacillota bacterium]